MLVHHPATFFKDGVGAAIEFGPHLALTAGYERYSGINSGLWLVSWQLAF